MSNRGALSPSDSRFQLYSLAENTLENCTHEQWWVKYIIVANKVTSTSFFDNLSFET